MVELFETFAMSVTRAYKYLSQIKKHESGTFDIKGIHVMSMVYLEKHPEGLTVSELASMCCEDKAAVSRTIDSLAIKGYVTYSEADAKRRWRSKIILTQEGLNQARDMKCLISAVVSQIRNGITAEEELIFYKVFARINTNLAKYISAIESNK